MVALTFPRPGAGGFDAWDVLNAAILVVGYGGAAALMIAGLVRLRRPDLLPAQLALPLYWVLHSIATVRAAHELLTRPYFWAKTTHGKTRIERAVVPEDEPVQAE